MIRFHAPPLAPRPSSFRFGIAAILLAGCTSVSSGTGPAGNDPDAMPSDDGGPGGGGSSGTGGGGPGSGAAVGSSGGAAGLATGGTLATGGRSPDDRDAGAGGSMEADAGPDGSSGTTVDGGVGGSGAGGMQPVSCIDIELGEETSGSANTSAETNDFDLSCGVGSAADVAFGWTAPFTDYFTFSTQGSSFDTVVAVFDDCDSGERACNNNLGSVPQGRAVAHVEQGQDYVVVVDGNAGERGSVSLSIEPVICPETDVSSLPLPASFSTVGEPNDHARDCVGETGMSYSGADWPEKTLRYVAPTGGLYRFSVTSSAFSPLLTVYRGVVCGGEYVQCNRNVVNGYPAEVTRQLAAGEAVTLVVEGINGEGLFELDVTRLPNADRNWCAALPALGSGKSGTITGTDHKVLSPSCSWAGNDPNSGVGHFPEHAFRFTVDVPNVFNPCSITVTANSSPLLVYVLDGSNCGGSELFCAAEELTFYDDDNGDYVLVVENPFPFGGSADYQISSTCD